MTPRKPSPERPLRAAALELGVDGRTLLAWTDHGCPVAAKGAQTERRGWRFRVAEVVAWLRERERAQAEARYAGELAELRAALAGVDEEAGAAMTHEEAKRRRAVAEARIAEYRHAALARRLVDVELAAQEVTRDYSGVRARVLQLATRATPRVVGLMDHAAAFEVLHEEACLALRDVSDPDAAEAVVERALDRAERPS